MSFQRPSSDGAEPNSPLPGDLVEGSGFESEDPEPDFDEEA